MREATYFLVRRGSDNSLTATAPSLGRTRANSTVGAPTAVLGGINPGQLPAGMSR